VWAFVSFIALSFLSPSRRPTLVFVPFHVVTGLPLLSGVFGVFFFFLFRVFVFRFSVAPPLAGGNLFLR